MRHPAAAAVLGVTFAASIAYCADGAPRHPASPAVLAAIHAAPLAMVQQPQEKPAAPPDHAVPADDAPLSRDEVIKQGPGALESNCMRCHGSDKWEGTNRDHDGWSAIVATMQQQMAEAQFPPLSKKTSNLIVDYLTLTRPQ